MNRPAFTVEFRCAACQGVLTYNQCMYSHGVCPQCGAVSDGTIVDYEKIPVKITPVVTHERDQSSADYTGPPMPTSLKVAISVIFGFAALVLLAVMVAVIAHEMGTP